MIYITYNTRKILVCQLFVSVTVNIHYKNWNCLWEGRGRFRNRSLDKVTKVDNFRSIFLQNTAQSKIIHTLKVQSCLLLRFLILSLEGAKPTSYRRFKVIICKATHFTITITHLLLHLVPKNTGLNWNIVQYSCFLLCAII